MSVLRQGIHSTKFTVKQSLIAFAIGALAVVLGVIGQIICLLIVTYIYIKLINGLLGDSTTYESKEAPYWLGLYIALYIVIRDFVFSKLFGFGYVFFEYSIILLCIFNFPRFFQFRKPFYKRITPFLLVFAVLCLISLAYSEDVLKGRWFLSIWLAGIGLILLLMSIIRNRRDLNLFFNGAVTGVLLLLGVGLMMTILTEGLMSLATVRFGTVITSSIQYGIHLSVGILFLSIKNSTLHRFSVRNLILTLGLVFFAILTGSRGVFSVTMFAFIGVYSKLFLSFNRMVWIMLFFVVSLIFSPINDNSFGELNLENKSIERVTSTENYIGDDERYLIWTIGIEMFKDRPIFGWGFGSWGETYKKYAHYYKDQYAPSKISDAHNFIVQLAVELGLVGLGVFIYILILILIEVINHKSYLGILIFFVVMLISFPQNFKIPITFSLLGLSFIIPHAIKNK